MDYVLVARMHMELREWTYHSKARPNASSKSRVSIHRMITSKVDKPCLKRGEDIYNTIGRPLGSLVVE